MAFGDRKRCRSRRSGWTQADQCSWEAQQRRERKATADALVDREAKLGRMSKEEREAFLADEQAERLRRDKEHTDRQERLRVQRREAKELLVDGSRLIAGNLSTEIASAISWKEKHDEYEGDWLDDPVAAMTTGQGFGEEVRCSRGIKLHVNLCLDCSNSMYHNMVHEISVACVRTLFLALEMAGKQVEGSLTVDGWKWALGESGKFVEHMGYDHWSGDAREYSDDNLLGPMSDLPGVTYSTGWTGEDTWMHTLLDELEQWEENHVDPGAYRLDLIITDGVLEHPTDARKCDDIQRRRSSVGVLQTVMLNFLPFEDWGDFKVPDRCVQYSVDADNIFAVLRSVLGDWLVSFV